MPFTQDDVKPDCHYLYRYRDAAGRLLYIGRSYDPLFRFRRGHKRNKDWANEVAIVDVEEYATEKACTAAETYAIETEAPLHNIEKQVVENAPKRKPRRSAAEMTAVRAKRREKAEAIELQRIKRQEEEQAKLREQWVHAYGMP